MITSPARTPAAAAGSLQNTAPIRAPDLAGAMLAGTGFTLALGRHRPLEFTPPQPASAHPPDRRQCLRGVGPGAALRVHPPLPPPHARALPPPIPPPPSPPALP